MKPFFAVFCICLALSFVQMGCSSETEQIDIDYGFAYFPMDSGFWAIYSIDSVIYSPFLTNGKDSIHVEVQDLWTNRFVDNEGRPATRIERRVRQSPNESWESITPFVWYAVRDSQRAEKMEGNLRYMNLVFPISEGKTWEGNIYLPIDPDQAQAFADWEYTYLETGVSQSVGNLDFPQTLSIVQSDYEDLVNKLYSVEKYAKNVGLIYKKQQILKAGNSTSNLGWPDRTETGYIVEMSVIDYKQ